MQNHKLYIFVCNWKMNQTIKNSINFIKGNSAELEKISKESHITICPSFPAIPFVAQEIKKLEINIGAQTCSSFEKGPYTGDVSATMLSEIGCSFCIVGHSERRSLYKQTNKQIYLKTEQLLDSKIIPILCIGETKKQKNDGETNKTIKKQLSFLPVLMNKKKQTESPICIAYEPIWAIGTGKAAINEEIEEVLTFIEKFLISNKIKNFALLYGGSVSSSNITNIKKIKKIDGFLIGNASLDFQELKKIVLS